MYFHCWKYGTPIFNLHDESEKGQHNDWMTKTDYNERECVETSVFTCSSEIRCLYPSQVEIDHELDLGHQNSSAVLYRNSELLTYSVGCGFAASLHEKCRSVGHNQQNFILTDKIFYSVSQISCKNYLNDNYKA